MSIRQTYQVIPDPTDPNQATIKYVGGLCNELANIDNFEEDLEDGDGQKFWHIPGESSETVLECLEKNRDQIVPEGICFRSNNRIFSLISDS